VNTGYVNTTNYCGSGLAREGGLTVAIKFKACRIYAHTHT
jgi:hypothetical protein